MNAEEALTKKTGPYVSISHKLMLWKWSSKSCHFAIYCRYKTYRWPTWHNSCCRRGERRLEEELGVDATLIFFLADEEEVTQAHETVLPTFLVAEAEREAEQPIGESACNDVDGVLHHDVHLVFGRHRPALEKTEACSRRRCVSATKRRRTWRLGSVSRDPLQYRSSDSRRRAAPNRVYETPSRSREDRSLQQKRLTFCIAAYCRRKMKDQRLLA